ncbi:MAG: lasso peptide biosynthesis B2 protein [Rhodocyclaceae bacterium]|nr:MAG: lasso peptide biosynthesis B2 protein [Rhodocyclaceae bacterium]
MVWRARQAGRAGPLTDMLGELPTTGISYCVCDDRAVFLDVERDRYFCLPSQLNQAFVRTVIDGDAMASADAERLRALGIEDPAPRDFAARRNTHAMPTKEMALSDKASSVLRAGATHWLVQSRLKRWPFARLLAYEQRRAPRRSHNPSTQTLAKLHAAFRRASLWMGEADQCLARSIAFRMLAFRLGFAPTLVLGIKLDPFAAHCWVQSEDCVANDSLERVRCFTPILAF